MRILNTQIFCCSFIVRRSRLVWPNTFSGRRRSWSSTQFVTSGAFNMPRDWSRRSAPSKAHRPVRPRRTITVSVLSRSRIHWNPVTGYSTLLQNITRWPSVIILSFPVYSDETYNDEENLDIPQCPTGNSQLPVILLGNKRDLEHTRQVQISEVSQTIKLVNFSQFSQFN